MTQEPGGASVAPRVNELLIAPEFTALGVQRESEEKPSIIQGKTADVYCWFNEQCDRSLDPVIFVLPAGLSVCRSDTGRSACVIEVRKMC